MKLIVLFYKKMKNLYLNEYTFPILFMEVVIDTLFLFFLLDMNVGVLWKVIFLVLLMFIFKHSLF